MTSWPSALINIQSCRTSAAYLGETDWGGLSEMGMTFKEGERWGEAKKKRLKKNQIGGREAPRR